MPDNPVVELRISDQWAGLGRPAAAEFVVRRRETGYELTGTIERSGFLGDPQPKRETIGPLPVSDDIVRQLGRALRTPAMPRDVGLARLSVPSWLDGQVDAAYAHVLRGQPACSPHARELFRAAFVDAAATRARLVELYAGMHTDDYPRVEVQARFADGTQVGAIAGDQSPLMLPWSRGDVQTWDPALAPALAALLPVGSPNRGRLQSDGLIPALAEAAARAIQPEWQDREERCRHRIEP